MKLHPLEFELTLPFIYCLQYLILLQVINCHDSVIYILTPLKYATIYGCSDATIVIGAIGKVCICLYFLISNSEYFDSLLGLFLKSHSFFPGWWML